jgi:ssDNA-binding Zn-finger/Zn-ribbon topoisomerase 1
MASENCPKCGTQMEVVKNKNRGYFASCPNKANHNGAPPAKAEKALAKETPKPAVSALKPARTLLGW